MHVHVIMLTVTICQLIPTLFSLQNVGPMIFKLMSKFYMCHCKTSSQSVHLNEPFSLMDNVDIFLQPIQLVESSFCLSLRELTFVDVRCREWLHEKGGVSDNIKIMANLTCHTQSLLISLSVIFSTYILQAPPALVSYAFLYKWRLYSFTRRWMSSLVVVLKVSLVYQKIK